MCTEIAVAGLGYDVPATTAWLDDLDESIVVGTSRQRDSLMPLCSHHADRLKVPVGWELSDRRARVAATGKAGTESGDVPAEVVSAPLFRPRSRPASATLAATEHQPPASSLLERAFRAAPTR